VRNYIEKLGIEVIEKLLERARKISLEVLKRVKGGSPFNRLATKTWYGKLVKGLGSSEKGSGTTQLQQPSGRVLLLAYK
jgi:hypothetical protein